MESTNARRDELYSAACGVAQAYSAARQNPSIQFEETEEFWLAMSKLRVILLRLEKYGWE